MVDSLPDIKKINTILNETVYTIESSREALFDIAEHIRKECEKLEYELKEIKKKVNNIISQVDKLEEEETNSRIRLANVSENFYMYDEEDMKEAYKRANALRGLLFIKRKEEKILIEKRSELELRLRETLKVLSKAEKAIKKIGVVSQYLKANIDDISSTINNLNKKQYFGIKVIEVQEEERQRLARDMHDGLAQSMASVLVKAQLCEKLLELDYDPKTIKEELGKLKQMTRDNLKDARQIIYDLRPMSLDDLGLIPTLKKYIYNFMNETNIFVELKVLSDVNDFKKAVKVTIFRIIQEALNNIRKHSRAKKVKIMIEKNPTKVNVIISDDGIGFNKEQNGKEEYGYSGGFGLISMKERAELLNGKLEIKSSPGMGTKVQLSIPLNKEEGEDTCGKENHNSDDSR